MNTAHSKGGIDIYDERGILAHICCVETIDISQSYSAGYAYIMSGDYERYSGLENFATSELKSYWERGTEAAKEERDERN